jgi:hypothetical protein
MYPFIYYFWICELRIDFSIDIVFFQPTNTLKYRVIAESSRAVSAITRVYPMHPK